jgi:hypothetical protein
LTLWGSLVRSQYRPRNEQDLYVFSVIYLFSFLGFANTLLTPLGVNSVNCVSELMEVSG